MKVKCILHVFVCEMEHLFVLSEADADADAELV